MRTAALLKNCLVVALFGCAIAEPPSGYSYNRPSGGFGGGFSGGFSGGFGGLSGGGAYHQVAPGPQTSEGLNVDYALLEQVKQVLLRDEASSGGGHSHGGLSSSYGVPSSSYGVPSYSSGRVVGLDLEGVQQAIQVAQYSQQSYASGGGYPSSSYGAPRAPSGSYGAPY
ncbi:conserved hypothetical protein [Pediculus humanus corporis]|uniref:Uncharacterized protein n=1 Tax=Pediculus humanus subsp. corporis TaxID=121224 RepID=E0VDG1_PEDHC|nr:uncharacterized protein Phum_PHUM114830 [Pediculus humanus corporis]EEB11417.1 conserved hypothetical protein [Pediculus humanus corporis]